MTSTRFRRHFRGTRVLSALLAATALLETFACAPGFAAEPEPTSQPPPQRATQPESRPKIALVLSGGGALGLAHIGAIQELERMGVRPDLVVGTSMGALVGGLYAAGLDGAELESAVVGMDWDSVFDSTPARELLTYRQKTQQAEFPVKASLGLKDGELKLPEAIVLDQNLMLALRRLTPAAAAVSRFDQLPIPFRAVATDIETGDRVVLDSGELTRAMRASMAVPGLFSAVELDGRLLVDGGMADNLPIDVAREMGADIVIAVAIQSNLLEKNELDSAVAVLGQTISLLVIANERTQLATLTPTDVLIPIDAGEANSADFKQGKSLIEVGRRSVLARREALADLAGAHERAPPGAVEALPRIDYVTLRNTSAYDDAVIRRKLDELVGQPAAADAIGAAVNRVYALGGFERVDYRLERDASDQTGLLVDAQGRTTGVGRVRLGLTVSNDFNSGSDYAVSFDYRAAPLDEYGAELRLQASVGDLNRLSGEYFQNLGPGQSWFVNSRLDLEAREVDLFDDSGFRLATYDLAYGLLGADVGYQFGSLGEARVGIERGTGEAELSTGVAQPSEIDIRIGRIVAGAGMDSLDNVFFPRSGARATLRYARGLASLGSAADYSTLAANALFASSYGGHTMLFGVAAGVPLQGDVPLEALYRLGGLFNLSGYQRDELSGAAFANARMIYRYTLPGDGSTLFGMPLFLGASLEAGEVWASRDALDLSDLRLAGSLYLAADTRIGPVYLAYGQAQDNRRTLYLFIGKPF